MSTVGNWRGPSIVKDSLILYLDAGSPNSYYPLSNSTTWKDISNNGYNGTLINGPVYNSINGGVLVFDGVDDHGRIPYNSNFDLSNTNYTLEGWFNLSTFSSVPFGRHLISKDTYGVNFDWSLAVMNSTTLTLYSNGTATNVTATVPTMSAGQWYHYVVTSISGVIRIYLNSILYKTQSMSTSNSSQVYVTLGRYSWNGPTDSPPGIPGGYINGYISTLRIYRKGLNDSEVLQNYNAYKGRFNL